MFLEHSQISFTLVGFFSVPSSSSPSTSHMCLQIISQVSPPTRITLNLTSFPFQTIPSFQSSPQLSVLIFSSQMTIAILRSWLLHSPHTWDVSKGCHKFLFIWTCNFFLIPSAKSFTWAYFCLTYRGRLWPAQFHHNRITQSTKHTGGFAVITLIISQLLAFKLN